MRCIFRQVDARGRHNHVFLFLSLRQVGASQGVLVGVGGLGRGVVQPPFWDVVTPFGRVLSRATTVVQVGFCQGYPVDFFTSHGK